MDKVLLPLMQGRIRPLKQDFSRRTHHYFKELPNGGLIDFNWPAKKVCNMVRAMNLGPVLDDLPRAKTFHQGEPFFIEKAAWAESTAQAEPGTVIEASREKLLIKAGVGEVEVLSARSGANELVSPGELIKVHGLSQGSVLG